MNNGPASVPGLVGVVPQKDPVGAKTVSSVCIRLNITHWAVLCELWARYCQHIFRQLFCAKVTQADSNKGDSVNRCIKQVKY